jgi:hypothetical protein
MPRPVTIGIVLILFGIAGGALTLVGVPRQR